MGGPGGIEENPLFTHTVAGPGEYFLKELLMGKKVPSFYRETKYPSYKFKLTDFLLNNLPGMNSDISLSIKTFDGCYWGKCYFCTYNSNYPCYFTEFNESRADIIAETMDSITSDIKKSVQNKEVTFYMSHASIGKEHLRILLNSIKKTDVIFRWVTFIRPEIWVMDFLKDIGECKGILDIGYEFLGEKDPVNKGISAEIAVNLSLKAYEHKIPLKANFLYCIPDTEEKDMIECAVNISRIRHTFTSFVLGQLFIEKETEFYRRSKDFRITCHDSVIDYALKDRHYIDHFEDYSGFRTLDNYDIFIENNKQFALSVAEIMETVVDTWEDPIDKEVKLHPISKEKIYKILSKYFGDKDYIRRYIEKVWGET